MPTIRFITSGKEVTFPEGDEVNLLRIAIRNDCGIPFKCASGNCGTDRVRVVEGLEHTIAPRKRERDRLGELLQHGYRLSCQTYVSGDVTVEWDPDQTVLSDVAMERLSRVWLSKDDTA